MTNSKHTKKALFSSIVALLLCFTMLIGATFAWFTDNVSSTGNRIQAGDLEVDLVMYKDGAYTSIADGTGDIFSEAGDGVWEPGKTQVVYLGVRNNGNLALKYNIIIDVKDGNPGLIGSLEYAVIDGAQAGDLATVKDWATFKANAQTGDIVEGPTLAAQGGVLDEIAYDATKVNETDYFALAVHMREEAGNEFENGAITIDVLVNATQKDAEEDSFGPDYDAGAENPTVSGGDGSTSQTVTVYVTSAEELQAAFESAVDGTILYFMNNITGDVKLTQKAGVSVVIDGLNREYTGRMTVSGGGRQDGTEAITIKNIDFIAKEGSDSCIVSPDKETETPAKYSYAHNVTIENCDFTDPDGVVDCAAVRTSDGGDKNWTIKNCSVDSTMHSLVQVQNIAGKLTISGCEVASKNGINLNSTTNVEIIDCDVNVKGYAVRAGVSTGGNPDAEKTFTIRDSKLKSANNDGDAVIILRKSAANANTTLTLDNTTITGNPQFAGTESATVTTIEEVGGVEYATTGDEKVLFRVTPDYKSASFTVPEGVTALADYAFYYNDSIEEVTLSSDVKTLGRAFDSNSTIKKVVLNEGLETIDSRAFKATTALEEVVIPSSVKTIADDAFQKTGLKTVTIPASVEYVGAQAFGSSKIETVIFEGNTTIQNKAFRGCANLRTVYMNGDDINFENTTGQANCWFCNSESNNPNVSNIDFYVKNETVKNKVLTAMGAEADNTDVYIQ